MQIASKKLEELSEIHFLTDKNEILKNMIIKSLTESNDLKDFYLKIDREFKKILEEIKENSNIQIITKNKNDQDILYLLEELIEEHKEQTKYRFLQFSNYIYSTIQICQKNSLQNLLKDFLIKENIGDL